MTFKEYKKVNVIKVKNTNSIVNRFYYVYRITNKLTKTHYYGSRVSKVPPVEDLGITYFSSSYDKDFIKEQKSNPKNFKYKVVRICLDNIEKQLFESYLHSKFNVSGNKAFYNKVKQTIEGFDCVGHQFNLGRKLTDETKRKIKTALTGRIVTQHTREKQRQVALARTTEENLLRGVPHKNKKKKKISEYTRNLLRKNNPASKIISILDADNNVVLVCEGTFKKDCESNSFPWASLRKAKNGNKLYIAKDGEVSKNIPEKSRKFIGWSIICE